LFSYRLGASCRCGSRLTVGRQASVVVAVPRKTRDACPRDTRLRRWCVIIRDRVEHKVRSTADTRSLPALRTRIGTN
jgi:hypothetical protein